MNRLSLLTILSLFYLTGSAAADTLRVTLDQAIQTSLNNGIGAAKVKEDSIADAGEWRNAVGGWFPQISLEGRTPSWDRARYSSGEQTSESYQGDLIISQELPWGATFRLNNSIQRYKSEIDQGIPYTNNYYRSNRSATLSQPLLAGNPVWRQYTIDKLNRESNLISHEIALRDIRHNVTTSFYALVEAVATLAITRQDLEQGRQSADLAERKMKAGLIPEVELLQIQVDVARRELSVRDADGAVESAMDDLRIQLGLDQGVVILPAADDLQGALPEAPVEPSLDQRPDARIQALGLRSTEIRTRGSLATSRLDASLDVSYNGSTLSETLDGARQNPQTESIGIDVSFILPVYGFGSTSGQIQKQKAELRSARLDYRLRLERLAADQRESFRRLARARDRIKISDSALELAERSYKITSERFANGLILSRDLLDAQLELTRTRRDAVSARIEYRLALSSIERFIPSEG